MKRTGVVSITLILCSCSYRMYEPNPALNPIFDHKGQVYASGQLTSFEGFDGQVAASLTSNIFATANYYHIPSGGGLAEKRQYLESSIGWFMPTDGSNESFSLGYGRGSVNGKPDVDNLHGKYYRLFFQLQKGKRTRYLESAVSCRLSYMKETDHNQYDGYTWIKKGLQHGFYFEPAGRVGFGYEQFRIIGQAGASVTVPKTGKARVSIYTSVGLSLQLDVLGK